MEFAPALKVAAFSGTRRGDDRAEIAIFAQYYVEGRPGGKKL
jgi:hypothetical protein